MRALALLALLAGLAILALWKAGEPDAAAVRRAPQGEDAAEPVRELEPAAQLQIAAATTAERQALRPQPRGAPETGRDLRIVWEGEPPAWSSSNPSGALLLLDAGSERPFRVPFAEGLGVLPEGRSLPVAVQHVLADGRAVHAVDDWLEEDGKGHLGRARERVLEITLDPPVRVVDDEDGADLDEVLRLPAAEGLASRSLTPIPYPGIQEGRPAPRRLGPSPVRRSELEGGAVLGAPGYVWRSFRWDPTLDERGPVRLARAGSLDLGIRVQEDVELPDGAPWMLELRAQHQYLVDLELPLDPGRTSRTTIDALAPDVYRVVLHALGEDGDMLARGEVEVLRGERATLELVVRRPFGLVHVPGTIALSPELDAEQASELRIWRPDGRLLPAQPRPGSTGGATGKPQSTLSLRAPRTLARGDAQVSWDALWLEPGEHAFQLLPHRIVWVLRIHEQAAQPLHLACDSWRDVSVELVGERSGEPVHGLSVSATHVIAEHPLDGPLARYSRAGSRFEPATSPLDVRIPCGARSFVAFATRKGRMVVSHHELDPHAGSTQTVHVPEPLFVVVELRERGRAVFRPLSWWRSVAFTDASGRQVAPATLGPLGPPEAPEHDRILLRLDGLGAGPYAVHVPGLEAPGPAEQAGHPLGLLSAPCAVVVDLGFRAVTLHPWEAR